MVPSYRRAVALPESAFSVAFINDRDAFLADLSGLDRLKPDDRLARRSGRPRRPTTVYNRRIQIMQLAGALVRRGSPAEAMTLPYIVEHAEDALRFFLDRLPAGETSGQVWQLALALKQLRKYLKVDGERRINEPEAEIIRRIFREFVAGRSPRRIAKELNRENIPAPRGQGWTASTIHGNRRRGTGILNNDLYVGRLVWNRQRFIKDPGTGLRVGRVNPEKDWIVEPVAELRIVSDDLWHAAKKRQDGGSASPA